MRKRTRAAVSLAGACALLGGIALPVVLSAGPAMADYAPNYNDVVGVGSDTLQYLLDFGADGDPSGDSGYNASGNLYKLINFDATADANARYSWAVGATLNSPNPLDPTVVLRQGDYPVQRINGSGAGISALLLDTGAVEQINFARMSSNPTAAEGATAETNGWQGLQDFVAGVEHLREAADLTTNAPNGGGTAGGLSTEQLNAIYSANQGSCLTWHQVDSADPSNDPIIPIIPQSGSGTRSTFLADIGNPTLGTCVEIGEENDPTAITSITTKTNPNTGGTGSNTTCYNGTATSTPVACSIDAIEPFSGARLNLWSGQSGNTTYGANPGTGYFHDPTANFPGGAVLVPGIAQMSFSGNASDGNPVYNDTRNLNIVYRWTDQISTTPWQPGGSLNWAVSLFCKTSASQPTPFFQTPAGKTLIAEAGADPSIQSCLTTPLT